MPRRLAHIIEIVAFVVFAILVGLWVWTQNGEYEPWTAVCAVVAGGLEVHRRLFGEEVAKSEELMEDSADGLLNWLLVSVSTKELSATLPSALRLAQKVGDKDFAKWVRLELYGYYDVNGMLDDDVVPKYRIVSGRYYNAYGQRLHLEDPELSFVNDERFRFGVRELEGYAKKTVMLYLVHEDMLVLIRERLGFDAVKFGFNPTSILGVLDAIRSQLIDRLHNIKDSRQLDTNWCSSD